MSCLSLEQIVVRLSCIRSPESAFSSACLSFTFTPCFRLSSAVESPILPLTFSSPWTPGTDAHRTLRRIFEQKIGFAVAFKSLSLSSWEKSSWFHLNSCSSPQNTTFKHGTKYTSIYCPLYSRCLSVPSSTPGDPVSMSGPSVTPLVAPGVRGTMTGISRSGSFSSTCQT